MNPTLDGRAPGVWASAVAAGTIASRNGNATVAPTPRKKVRLGNAVFVRNMCDLLPSRLESHLKGSTRHDPIQKRCETILLLCRVAHDLSNDRHVVRGEAAAQC